MILYFRVTRKQLSLYQLLVRLFVGDHMIFSEFIVVVRYGYQLLVICDTIVFVAISPVFYFRCQILVVSYSVVRCHQLSDISCQLSDYQLLLTSLVVRDISYYYILNHIDCLLIKVAITWGTKVVLATYSVVSCQGYARITAPH